MRFLFIFISLGLIGCGSTPYRDDYTKYVNLIPENYFDDSSFKFSFVTSQNVDLRGLYSQNDVVDSTPILYQGGPGLAGLAAVLIQVGGHSSLVQHQRNEKLSREQEKANEPILPLINLTKELPLIDLLGKHRSQLVSTENDISEPINIKPIFFSNSDMTKLSLKSVVWLPFKDNNKGRKKKFKYKNLIQVYSQKLNKSQQEKLVNGDKEFISEVLSSLLTTAIHITKNELTGQYSKVKSPNQTFFIEDGSDKKVIRGSVVAETCGYQIIQDIHSWFIAYPKPEITTSINNDFTTQC